MGTISLLHPFSSLPPVPCSLSLSPSLAWFDMPHALRRTESERGERAATQIIRYFPTAAAATAVTTV